MLEKRKSVTEFFDNTMPCKNAGAQVSWNAHTAAEETQERDDFRGGV